MIQGGVVVVNAEGGGRLFNTKGMKVMMDNLTHMVDCENSECAVPADFTREMGRIRTMDGGVDRVNRIVRGVLEGAQHSISAGVPEVDAFVHEFFLNFFFLTIFSQQIYLLVNIVLVHTDIY